MEGEEVVRFVSLVMGFFEGGYFGEGGVMLKAGRVLAFGLFSLVVVVVVSELEFGD